MYVQVNTCATHVFKLSFLIHSLSELFIDIFICSNIDYRVTNVLDCQTFLVYTYKHNARDKFCRKFRSVLGVVGNKLFLFVDCFHLSHLGNVLLLRRYLYALDNLEPQILHACAAFIDTEFFFQTWMVMIFNIITIQVWKKRVFFTNVKWQSDHRDFFRRTLGTSVVPSVRRKKARWSDCVKWLRYCRYGVTPSNKSDQSINQLINHFLFFIPYMETFTMPLKIIQRKGPLFIFLVLLHFSNFFYVSEEPPHSSCTAYLRC